MLWNQSPSARACASISSRLSGLSSIIASPSGRIGDPERGLVGGGREQPDRLAVAVQRPDIDIGLARADPLRPPAAVEIFVDEGPDILVLPLALAPQRAQLVEDGARHLEGA